MNKKDLIKWMKIQKESVLNTLYKQQEASMKEYERRFVLSRVTVEELEGLRELGAEIHKKYRLDLMARLTDEGPSLGWLQPMNFKELANCDDMIGYFTSRLNYNDRGYVQAQKRWIEKREQASKQWSQLIAHAETIFAKDIIELLSQIDITPPEDAPKPSPVQLPAVTFNRATLLGE